MSLHAASMLSFFRAPLCYFIAVVIVTISAVTTVTPVQAEERNTPVVGSFGVGDNVSGEINERTGEFTVQLPLVSVPGVVGSGMNLGLSYSSNNADSGINRYGLGDAWTWSLPHIDVNGGVRVFPASGGMFEADASWPSGLARYTLKDTVFTQVSGTLPAREGVDATADGINYAFSLETLGQGMSYFNAQGDFVAHVGMFGERTDVIWQDSHRLVGVVDDGGNRATVAWTETGFEIFSPSRSDGLVSKTVVEIANEEISSVINPVEEKTTFAYENARLSTIHTASGAVTNVAYQTLPDTHVAVESVRVADSTTGEVLATRQWKIGDAHHTASGWPTYLSGKALWASGDEEYRYDTVLTDGFSKVESTYNSLSSLIFRDVEVSTPAGDTVVQKQEFTYPSAEIDGIFNPQALPPHYQKPTQVAVVFRDDRGTSRQVTQQTAFDEYGRVTKQISQDATVTETVYDTEAPAGLHLPSGLVREHTTTGADGLVSQTMNTFTDDHKAVRETETFTGANLNALESVSRTEMVVERDGFVSEKRLWGTQNSQSPHGSTESHEQSGVVTRFARSINDKTVTVSETSAAGTPAEATKSSVSDKATGLTVLTIDATGRRASTTYDLAGRVTSQTNPAGLREVTTYGGKVSRVTDPSGITRSEYVDVLGRVVKLTDNITATSSSGDISENSENRVFAPIAGFERTLETRAYEKNSSTMRVKDVDGLETVTTQDVFGRPREVIAPNGVRHVTEYDDVNNTVRSGIVTAHTGGLERAEKFTETVRDNADRPTVQKTVRQDGVRVPNSSTRYDGLGRVTGGISEDLETTTVLNADGGAKTTTLTPTKPSVFSGEPLTARREHDTVFGVPVRKDLSQADTSREGVSRVLDSAGRVASQTDQAGNSTTYEYTVDDLIAVIRNTATGVVTRNTFDPVTRALTCTETTAPDGSSSLTAYEYDPVTGATLAIFDPSDRAGTEIRYAYDIFGNTTHITYPDGKTLHHIFDENGRRTASADITGNITRYEYNRYGFLSKTAQTTPENTPLAWVEYEYDKLGRVVKLTRDNEVTTSYTFTVMDQIETETTTHGDALIFQGQYTYDSHGNLAEKTQTQQRGGGDFATETDLVTETNVYTYDAFNRLTSSAVYRGDVSTGTPEQHSEYTLNVSGDVTKEVTKYPVHNLAETGGATQQAATGEGTETSVREFTYNQLGHLTTLTQDGIAQTQEYDNAGNLIRACDGTRYEYNVYNQPVTQTRPDGNATHTSYWVTGKQASRTDSSLNAVTDTVQTTDVTGFYWEADTLINDTHTLREGVTTEGVTTNETEQIVSYLFGASRHSRTVMSAGVDTPEPEKSTQHYVTDRHNNTVALTNTTGSPTTTYAYTDYGRTTEGDNRVNDPSTERGPRNPFMYAGEYTTQSGTQLLGSRVYDPCTMRFTTQDTAELYNLYAYAGANPITMVDPTGQKEAFDSSSNFSLSMAGFFLATFGFFLALNAGSVGLVKVALAGVGFDMFTAGFQFINEASGDFLGVAARVLSLISFGVGVFTLGAGFIAYKTAAGAKTVSQTLSAVESVAFSDTNVEMQNFGLSARSAIADRRLAQQEKRIRNQIRNQIVAAEEHVTRARENFSAAKDALNSAQSRKAVIKETWQACEEQVWEERTVFEESQTHTKFFDYLAKKRPIQDNEYNPRASRNPYADQGWMNHEARADEWEEVGDLVQRRLNVSRPKLEGVRGTYLNAEQEWRTRASHYHTKKEELQTAIKDLQSLHSRFG